MTKYGLDFPDGTDPLMIERHMIRKGGRFLLQGQHYGEGLFHHYREAQRLLWPSGEDHHRWSDLMLQEILANRLTAITGSRDSGKTHVALARFGLTDYFMFPEETLILVSSTDLRGLQLRVWGDMKDMFTRAKDLTPWLPGNVVESLHGIFTDKLSDDCPVRDIRRGIICFATGTPVDTPKGQLPIESIKPGDWVYNAIGVGRVKACGDRFAQQLVRVALADGRTADCTPGHLFLTQDGWKKAIDLKASDVVLSAHEAMCIVWGANRTWIPEPQILFSPLSRSATAKAVRTLRQIIQAIQAEAKQQGPQRQVLRNNLCVTLGSENRREAEVCHPEMFALRQTDDSGAPESALLQSNLSSDSRSEALPCLWPTIHFNLGVAHAQDESFLQSVLQEEISWPFQFPTSFQSNAGGTCGLEIVPDGDHALSSKDRPQDGERTGTMVRAGHRLPRHQTGYRDRWWGAQYPSEQQSGCLERSDSKGTRVDHVEVLKPAGDKRFNCREGGYRVHNLEVDGHPSYSVNGVIVHNCIPCLDRKGAWVGGLEKFVGIKQKRRRLLGDEVQFMHHEYLTVLSNLDEGDFKGVFVGNTLANRKALDRIAEPVEGWENRPQPTKTEVFKNKFDGRTIQLIGTDSPNFDVPEGSPTPFKYMVSRESERRVGDRWGRDSEQYHSQISGLRKTGLFAHRVLTEEMCKRGNAFGEVVWGTEEPTRIYAVDCGYGGDRAVAGYVEFGLDVTGSTILMVRPPGVIPISVETDPEDQIALYTKKECDALSIPGSHMYFDAGMRATAATALAKLFSPEVNAVNFGGTPSKRPVSRDEYVLDRLTGSKRLKLCDEHFDRFITELWFMVRLAVIAGQVRGLPVDVAEEFYQREWAKAKGDRYELETKEDMKLRVGFSPDLADWLVIALEGARRHGFMIEGVPEGQSRKDDDPDYLQKELERYNQERKKRQLNYSMR